jgi:hypothetical protein
MSNYPGFSKAIVCDSVRAAAVRIAMQSTPDEEALALR